MINFETCRQDFEPDGALRDIYVHNTSIEHWRMLFDMLRRDYNLEFFVDLTAEEIPSTVDEVFAVRETANPMLHFNVGGVLVVCHFFAGHEIEFDIDPQDVNSQAALDELLRFLGRVGDHVRRTVILSYENDQQHPFISYDPETRKFQYYKGLGPNDSGRSMPGSGYPD